MPFNDASSPHPITLGVIVPLANKAAFRTQLRAQVGTTQFDEIKRILAGDDALLAPLTDAVGIAITANGLNVHLTTEEWGFLKTTKQLLDPATRALVEFSQLQSASRPADPTYWEWAATLGYFPYVAAL